MLNVCYDKLLSMMCMENTAEAAVGLQPIAGTFMHHC